MIQHTHNWSAQRPENQNKRIELSSHKSCTPQKRLSRKNNIDMKGPGQVLRKTVLEAPTLKSFGKPREKKKGVLVMLMVGVGAGAMVLLFTLPTVLNGFGRMWRDLDFGSCHYLEATWNPAWVLLMTWQRPLGSYI